MFEEPTETNVVNLKLVKEIEKHPVLYDCLRSQKKAVIEQAWQEVADALNMSVAECRYRWQNVKTVFKRKVRISKDGTWNSPSCLDKAMEFYLPFMSLTPTVRANSKKIKPKPQKITVTPLLPTEVIVDSMGTCDNKTFIRNNSIVFGNKTPNVTNSEHQYVVDYLTSEEESLQMTEAESSSERINRHQSAKMFLLSLMPELEDLNDNQIKLFKRRVLSAIDDVSNC